MKKIKLIIYILYLINLPLVAQTDDERRKISESYNINNLNKLIVKLKDYNLLKETRIEDYLKSNAGKRRIDTKGHSYIIYDIINESPIYMTSDNVDAARATNTVELHLGGSMGLDLEGENMIIGAWDIDHPLGTHVEYLDDQVIPQTRVTYPDLISIGLLKVSDHATHVCGTLIAKGSDPLAKGMAPKANLRAFTAGNDEPEATNEAAAGLLISNHSYGVPIFIDGSQQVNSQDIGAYTSAARNWDQITFNAPYYLPVMSAGNEGGNLTGYSDGLAIGYDKLTFDKVAKNTLVVASALPIISGGKLLRYLSSTFSSEGPTDDFRVKPDITSDGNLLYSSVSTDIDAYEQNGWLGTSMSAPSVSGPLILLQQYYNQLNSNYMKAATLKALVCHNAKDDNNKIGPDPVFGWGFFDAETSALTIKDASNGLAIINELSLNNGETYTYQFSASGNGIISATICWTDPAGPKQSNSLNDPTPRLVNDLDLRLENSSNTVFFPWKLDNTNAASAAIKGDNIVDNIENIDFTSGSSDTYTLTVSHKGSITNGSQAFSLILTGADLTLGVSDKLISSVSVWPNPANEKLNLSFKSQGNKIKISLYNLHGKEVYMKNLENRSAEINHSIYTKDFYSGIYFLNIQNGNKIYNKKILIN